MAAVEHKYVFRMKDTVDENEERVEVRVFGPVSQHDVHSSGYWAGNWNPDELEQLGLTMIQAAHDKRNGRSVEGIKI